MKDYCECDDEGQLNPIMASWYDPNTELPFVTHKPGECRCANELREYVRDGKVVTLCSCCNLRSDKPVES